MNYAVLLVLYCTVRVYSRPCSIILYPRPYVSPYNIILYIQNQWLRFISDHFITLTALEGAEIIPGKYSDTRIIE
jgi:hypothetical protein